MKNDIGNGRPVRKIKVRLIPPEEKRVVITTPFIKLDAAMKLADVVGSGGMAKVLIENEQVRVNGEVCTQRGKKLYPGDSFRFENTVYEVAAKE